MAVYHEAAREVPVLGEWEVVVCGGGPAGCAAALSAARHGAKVLLVEREGALGGAPVAQGVMTILSTNGADFQGVWHEWARALQARGGISPVRREKRLDTTWFGGSANPEMVKFAWDDLLTAAGVELLHLVLVAGAIVEEGKITGVLVETKAGRRAIRAQRVVDCTGDADVCAAAGSPWEQGVDGDPWAMGVSLSAWYGGGRIPEGYRFGEFNPLAGRGRSLGMAPLFWAGILRILKVDTLNPWELTRALREGRAMVWERWQEAKKVPGQEGLFLAGIANVPGVRSSRRVRGVATMTGEDAWELKKYADGIARASWEIDIHSAKEKSDGREAHMLGVPRREARKAKVEQGDYFDIRYGSLLPQGVENLLVAGKCLSAEHEAQSSLRIQQTCMATGQAAGTAAAVSLQRGVWPSAVDVGELVSVLEADRSAAGRAEVLEV